MADDDQVVARTSAIDDAELRKAYERANEREKCPFDKGELDPAINQPVYPGASFKYWNAWLHPKPRRGLATHIIIATIEHHRDFSELSEAAKLEYFRILEMLKFDFDECYALVSRPGGGPNDCANSASVWHLSVHFEVSDRWVVSTEDVPEFFRVLYAEARARTPEGEDSLKFMGSVRDWFDYMLAAEQGWYRPVREKVTGREKA